MEHLETKITFQINGFNSDLYKRIIELFPSHSERLRIYQIFIFNRRLIIQDNIKLLFMGD